MVQRRCGTRLEVVLDIDTYHGAIVQFAMLDKAQWRAASEARIDISVSVRGGLGHVPAERAYRPDRRWLVFDKCAKFDVMVISADLVDPVFDFPAVAMRVHSQAQLEIILWHIISDFGRCREREGRAAESLAADDSAVRTSRRIAHPAVTPDAFAFHGHALQSHLVQWQDQVG